MAPDQTTATSRILVGIDGSPSSLDALRWAGRQAELTGAALDVVMTWDWPPSYGWGLPFPEGFDPDQSAQKVLDEAITDLRSRHPGLTVSSRVLQGHPSPILVEASQGADLLVVGSRGHGEFAGMLIGSVSEYCSTHAHCPVTIVR